MEVWGLTGSGSAWNAGFLGFCLLNGERGDFTFAEDGVDPDDDNLCPLV